MSILFGVRKSVETQVQLDQLESLARATAKYALDGIEVKAKGRLGMAVQPYYTHRRSRLGNMMAEDEMGNRVSLDGRLDNVKALCEELHISSGVCDADIVLRSFLAYGEAAFSRFVGDWALVLWSEQKRELYLARDHAGARTLYYEVTEDGVLWGTYLESFFSDGQKRGVNRSYISAFLCSQITHLATPYEGINVVPPAHFVAINEAGRQRTKSHWNCMIGESLQYKTDAEYEEQFLHLFLQAVERRTEHDDLPILAELSGGMDSSSIVCVSDAIRKENGAAPDRLIDTVSFYDKDDPDWDEMPFVACIEEARQKIGTHLPLPLFRADFTLDESYLHPGGNRATFDNDEQFERAFCNQPHRTILSGLGGDELLGGFSTGLPELSDYLVTAQVGRFIKQSIAWCIPSRRPLLHEWTNVLRFLLQQYFPLKQFGLEIPPWGTNQLKHSAATGPNVSLPLRTRLSYPPSRIANGFMWWMVLETLPHMKPHNINRREYRYPFLDRDLVEFLFRVPRERLLVPGRRRALMRRALSTLVPSDILERKRKAYRSRAILPMLAQQQTTVMELCSSGYAVSSGLVKSEISQYLEHVLRGVDLRWLPALSRLVLFELWISAHSTQRRLDLSSEIVAGDATSGSGHSAFYVVTGNSQQKEKRT